ncbi:DUF6481 family protein [Prosthecomicrobium sp. N25]|uniref:DUF6481 family protein n=1 Tax=Prosthecomicrobium sp. N25 TaxID=3129254 RepID=UPI003077407B
MKMTVDLADRRKNAAEAKALLLQKFKAGIDPNDPAAIARAAERKAVAEARAVREEARRREREAAAAAKAIADEEARKAAIAEAAAAEVRREEAERLAAEEAVADEARKKAARDERYAARKLRKQQGDQHYQPGRKSGRY